MAVRIRRNVWGLPPGDDTLLWYRRAIAEMFQRDTDQPDSWRYQAAIHGVPSGMQTPAAAAQFWDQCQHQSWFFLPWHRGYLASFEAVVAKTIADLGGPAEWALPYWDYSEDLTLNPQARTLPPDFRIRELPDGSFNFLWSRRAQVSGGDFGIGPNDVTLAALRLSNFTNDVTGQPSGFGGPVTGFNPGGGDNGALESTPHNIIHVRLGGQSGFMSDPRTAALDPIFWLHHCNIDRLWELWLNRSVRHANPDDPNWLAAQAFNMHDAANQPITFTASDMLDTTTVMHGYRYDTVPVAAQRAPAGGLESMADARPTAEMVGASDTALQLGVDRTQVRVSVKKPEASALEGVTGAPQQVYLNLENVTGTGMPGNFDVYIDLPDDAHPPMRAGVLTTFGLERASDPTREHGGNGLTQVFDISGPARILGLTTGSVEALQVTFVRQPVGATDDDAPPGLESMVPRAATEPSISVGRISIYVS